MKSFFLALFFLVVFSCTQEEKASTDISSVQDEEDQDEEDQDEEDQDEEDQDEEGQEKDSGISFCDDQCIYMCRDATRNITQEDQCKKLSPTLVEGFYKALNTRLKKPINYNKLSNVEPEDIKNVMEINSFSLFKNVQDYAESDTVKILNWMAGDSLIMNAFYDDSEMRDEADDILKELFRKLSPKLKSALSFSLDGDKNFLTIAGRAKNSKAISRVHKLFSSQCVRQANEQYNPPNHDKDDLDHFCVLGELYCKNRGEVFKHVFQFIVHGDQSLLDYIRKKFNTMDREDSLDLKKVCGKKFCKVFPSTVSC